MTPRREVRVELAIRWMTGPSATSSRIDIPAPDVNTNAKVMGVFAGDGLDIVKLTAHVAATGSVVGFAGAQAISNAELLKVECDVLVPAALGHVIDGAVAKDVRAQYELGEILDGKTGDLRAYGRALPGELHDPVA